MTKFIFSFLMQFFTSRQGSSALNAQGQLLNAVTTTLKKEISELVLKISIGLVATGVLIYSLITLGNYFHGFLLKYQYGTAFSILFFTLLSAGCIFLVFKLFYKKQEQADPFADLFSKSEDKGFSIERIYTTFLDGLNAGMAQNKNKEATDKEKDTTDSKPPGMVH